MKDKEQEQENPKKKSVNTKKKTQNSKKKSSNSKTTTKKSTTNKKTTSTSKKKSSTSKSNPTKKQSTTKTIQKKTKTTAKKDQPKKKSPAKKKIDQKENVVEEKLELQEQKISEKVPTPDEPKQLTKEIEEPSLKELELEIKKDITPKHQFKLNIIIWFIILIILIVMFVLLHIVTPDIKLNGKTELELSYNDKYIEKGAKAKLLKLDLTKKIKISGKVNTKKIGTYEVIYSVKEGIFQAKKKRIINVVDKKKPVINLVGDQELNICPNSEYKEIGFTAIDEYDGDLTKKVKIKDTKDGILYSVEDSSHNTFSITRKINKIDKEKPVITLKGNKTMYLGLDNDFHEPGYTAEDNCSGNLTSKVVVSGEVKSRVKGTYTLTYSVTDNYGNAATTTRKIIISQKTNPDSGIIKNGVIYLTFDDGPSSATTGTILDVLKEEGVKATFFVTNSGPDNLIKRMYDEGHTVALHTASHNYSYIYSSEDNYFADLMSVSNRVERITGQVSKIMRFPGGSSNTVSRRYSSGIMTRLSEAVFSRGYRYYDWNVDSGDASTSKTKDAVYSKVVNNLSKSRSNIVLMHDIKYQTRDAIRDIIHYGKNNGYTFERIDMDTYMVRQKINN